MTVVIAQTANAFACRSSTRWPGSLGWSSNHLLVPAAALELLFSILVVMIGPIADELGHAPPPAIGWLLVDAADKWWRTTDAHRSSQGSGRGSHHRAR